MPDTSLWQAAVAVLCVAGIYVSSFMLRKYQSAQRGELHEPSVVTSARARIGSLPNAASGLIYYMVLLAIAPFLTPAHPWVVQVALGASVLAALASIYLAYSLLFVTRMTCTYCWIGHCTNWALLVVLLLSRRGITP